MDTDRNLLFGVLALQADLITEPQFVEACSAWACHKAKTLADYLVERGWLSPEDRADVQKVLERKLKKHHGDARVGLAEASTDRARQSLATVSDPDIQASLQALTPSPAGPILLSTTDHIPETLDRYTLSRLHSTGGIGRVWLARDTTLNREVALKELRPERAVHAAVRARFLKEVQITGQLEHPGVAPIYEMGKRPEDNQPFYTMRFVRGRTLAEAIHAHHSKRQKRQTGALGLRNLLQAFVVVCNTVAYAHARGVIHRDLKPQNVVLGDYGEVIVLDWGMAKLVGAEEGESAAPPVHAAVEDEAAATVEGQVMGTPAYMSPEQAGGRLDSIDARTDIYGLGAILYQILTGRPPFSGEDTASILRRVLSDTPKRPRERVAGTPLALEAVCLKAMGRRPKDRYPRAQELAREVEHWLADEPVEAYRDPLTLRTGRWMRRHKAIVAAAAMLLITAVIALTIGNVLLGAKQREIAVQRDTALTARAQADTISNFLSEDLLGQASPEENQRDKKMTVEQLLGRAAARIESSSHLAEQPAVEASLRLVIGNTYRGLGEFEKAEPHLRRAMELRRTALGLDNSDTLTAQEDLATLLAVDLRQPDLTLNYDTWQARMRVLGPEDPKTLDSMDGYGTALHIAGRTKESEPILRECLEIMRRAHGEDHRLTVRLKNNLGTLLNDIGQWDQAEPLLADALEERRRTIGMNKIQTLGLLNNLSISRLMLGKGLPEVEKRLREGIDIMRQSHGETNPYYLHLQYMLSRVLLEEGKLDEAENLGRRVLSVRLVVLPKIHESIGRSQLILGRTLVQRGKAEEAEPLLRNARALFREHYAAKRELSAQAEDWLGASLTLQKRYKDAEPLLLSAEKTLRAHPGISQRQREDSLAHLIQLYESSDRRDEASAWRAKREKKDPP